MFLVIFPVLLGCTASGPATIPPLEITQTYTAPPEPSQTPFPSITPSPTDKPAPSPSLPPTTATTPASPVPSATTYILCQPGEYEAFFDDLGPYADQLLFLTHEVARFEELSKPRAEEILTIVQDLESGLKELPVPICFLLAYEKLVEARKQLISGIEAYLNDDPDLALEEIKKTLLSIAEVATEFMVMSMELTATSTPEG